VPALSGSSDFESLRGTDEYCGLFTKVTLFELKDYLSEYNGYLLLKLGAQTAWDKVTWDKLHSHHHIMLFWCECSKLMIPVDFLIFSSLDYSENHITEVWPYRLI